LRRLIKGERWMIQGRGFMIWNIKTLPRLEEVIRVLVERKVSWVTVKVLDGVYLHNCTDAVGNYTGNQDYLKYWISEVKKHGIHVGGWAFLYTSNIKKQAQLANSLTKSLGLDSFILDVEELKSLGANWKDEDAAEKAEEYMRYFIKPSKDYPLGLCSYRYPSYHREFPFAAFLNDPKINMVNAQVYWMFSNNSGAQLLKSVREYDATRRLTHVPIGAMFSEHGWTPTTSEMKDFLNVSETVLKNPGAGFWVLDEAIYNKEWLDVIYPIDVQPEPEPEPGELVKWKVLPSVGLRVRESPNTSSRTWFTLPQGSVVEELESIVENSNEWLRVGQRQYVAKTYQGQTYLEVVNG
jgi:hypothetical protein